MADQNTSKDWLNKYGQKAEMLHWLSFFKLFLNGLYQPSRGNAMEVAWKSRTNYLKSRDPQEAVPCDSSEQKETDLRASHENRMKWVVWRHSILCFPSAFLVSIHINTDEIRLPMYHCHLTALLQSIVPVCMRRLTWGWRHRQAHTCWQLAALRFHLWSGKLLVYNGSSGYSSIAMKFRGWL